MERICYSLTHLELLPTVVSVIWAPCQELPEEVDACSTAGNYNKWATHTQGKSGPCHACNERACKTHENRPYPWAKEKSCWFHAGFYVINPVLTSVHGIIDNGPTGMKNQSEMCTQGVNCTFLPDHAKEENIELYALSILADRCPSNKKSPIDSDSYSELAMKIAPVHEIYCLPSHAWGHIVHLFM